MIKINTRLLKSKRLLNGFNQKKIAEKLNVSIKTYCIKENGKVSFNINEIIILANEFNLSLKEVNQIFFNDNLPNVYVV